MMREVFFVK